MNALLAHAPMAAGTLEAARSQMAFTLGFHIILASLGVAFPAIMLIANYRGLKHNDPDALLLARRWSQVVAVTHLPQVAAFADRHYRVVKSDDGSVTTSGVQQLDEAARVRELSRMLAGLEGSATAEAHARELLDLAASERDGAATR